MDGYDVEGVARQVYSEILSDMQSGQVSPSVRTFTELHDHVDANDYISEVPWGTDLPHQKDDPAGVRLVVAIQNRVNELLERRAKLRDWLIG